MKFNLSVVVGGEGSADAGKKQGLGIDSDEPEGKTDTPEGQKDGNLSDKRPKR